MKKLLVIASIAMLLLACDRSSKEKQGNMSETNPFFSDYTTPYQIAPFDQIKFEHYKPAFEEGMKQQAQEIEAIVNNTEAPTFENTVVALEQSGQLLGKVSDVFFNLLGTVKTDDMQNLAKELSPLLSTHGDNIYMNAKLFAKVKAVYENKTSVKGEDLILLEKTFKNFEKKGANLNDKQQARLREINKELGLLTLQFGDNVLSDQNNFKLWIDKEEDLAGLPQSVRDAARSSAESEGEKDKWLFTSNRSSLTPFLQYASKRDLREKMYKAYINKGDNANEFDNNDIISKQVALRAEKAALFGFENHSAFMLHDRMSKKPEHVFSLLNQLWTPALEVAKKEALDMQKMIQAEGGKFELAGWDWWYYAEKIRKERYDLSDEDTRPYFKLENVERGAFDVAKKLWGLEFKQVHNLPLYHEDVRTFEVREANGELVGILYAEYHPRKTKRAGAWMSSFRKQSYKDGKKVLPIITMNCNFTNPTADKPALLSFGEVNTLFHEFGHCLHGLLSDCKYNSLSGTSVARDFVELPSQIMEHWAAEPAVIKAYAKHYKTGEAIPDELIEKMEKSGQFNQGFVTTEYLTASILDMKYHTLSAPAKVDPDQFEKDVAKEIGLIPQIVSRYRSTYFNHIFSGSYSSGYYSYIWAEVLDSDAYEAFKESGDIYNPDLAKKFRDCILSKGGTVEEGQMYRNFRGRDPQIKPLLKNRGLI